jgi:hypothetical protein
VFLCDLCGKELPFPIPSVDHAFNAIFQVGDVEIDQQPNAFPAEAEIRQKLSLMDRVDAIYALDLNNHQIFDEQINAITEFQFLSLVDHGQTNLSGHVKSSLAEFVRQASLVSTLQQPRAELGMDFHRRIDDGARNLVNAGRSDRYWTGHVISWPYE